MSRPRLLRRLKAVKNDFQDIVSYYMWSSVAEDLANKWYRQGLLQLTPKQRDVMRFPNETALALTVLLEVPLRGLALFPVPISAFESAAWAPVMTRLALHVGLRTLVQDVLDSDCLTDDALRAHVQGLAAILSKHGPLTLVSVLKKQADRPFADKRKQALARGFELGFAKMKLREGQEDKVHKKRADAANAKRMGSAGAGAGAGVASAGAGAGVASAAGAGAGAGVASAVGAFAPDGLTAFLTADWADEDGVYSDSDEEDGGDAAPPPSADLTAVMKDLADGTTGLSLKKAIGRFLAYWCLEGLPKLTPTQIARDILGPVQQKGIFTYAKSQNKEFLQEYLQQHVDMVTKTKLSPVPVLVHNTIMLLNREAESVLVPKGFKYVKQRGYYHQYRELKLGMAQVLEEVGMVTVYEPTKRLTAHEIVQSTLARARIVDWADANALVTLNDSLRVQDTWVPIEVAFRIQGKFVPAFEIPLPDALHEEVQWVPEWEDLQMVHRMEFVPRGRPPSMSVAMGLAHLGAHQMSVPETKRRIQEGSWPPFRSMDAGLGAVSVVTYALGDPRLGAAEDASVAWTYTRDPKQKQHTAESMKDMIRALSGFLDPDFGEPIAFVSEGMRERQAETLVPLIIEVHSGTYEWLLAASASDLVAKSLAMSLSPKTLWFLAVLVLAPERPKDKRTPDTRASDHARFKGFLADVRRAAAAVLDAIPGPCFPVCLNVGPKTVWELRPKRKLHGHWFVDVPMALPAGYAGVPSTETWEPMLLPADFFLPYRDLPHGRVDVETYLSTGLLRYFHNNNGLSAYSSMVREFVWHSAGLACVAPAALLFLTGSGALCARLQLLWTGTEDVDTNPLTHNNVRMLDEMMPPMAECKKWMEESRGRLRLPTSGLGLRQAPVFIPHYPDMERLPTVWGEGCVAFARSFGTPLDDYSRMDVDRAVAMAPADAADVKVAALELRAALFEEGTGDEDIEGFFRDTEQLCVAVAACFRCNGVLPLRESMFAAAGQIMSDRYLRKRKRGIDYTHAPKRPDVNSDQQYVFREPWTGKMWTLHAH